MKMGAGRRYAEVGRSGARRPGSFGAASPSISLARVPPGATDCRSRRGSTQSRLRSDGGTPPDRHPTRRGPMQVVDERCCGLDVHKRSVVACLIVPGPGGGVEKEVRTFGTMTDDLERLAAWLASR